MELELTEGVRVKVAHFARVRQDYGAYRVVLNFISDHPDKNRLIKEYYVWLTDIFTEDFLHIRHGAKKRDYEKVALQLAKQRFDSKLEVPPENGLDASNERGTNRIVDAVNFIHPVEKDNV
jgi:hypothetical protein